MSKRALVLIVGVFAAGLLAAGCGGDDSSGDSGSELTKAEFVEQASAICVDASKSLSEALEAGGADDFVSATVEAMQTEADEIAALGVPAEGASQVEAMLQSLQRSISTVESEPKNIGPATEALRKAEDLADDFGLKSCLLS